MEKEMNFVSAVIYAGSQTEGMGEFLKSIHTVLSSHFQQYEIICVNDCADGLVLQEIKRIKQEKNMEAFTVVNMAQGRGTFGQGLEKSMVAGRDMAIGDYVFEFDSAVMDYEEHMIMDAYYMTAQGYDIVSVSAEDRSSRLGSRIFYKLYNHYSNTPYKIGSESLRVLSRRAINRVETYGKTMPYRKAVYAFSGLELANLKYRPKTNRRKADDIARWDTASDAIILFTNLAYKLSLFFSAIMAVLMFSFGIYVIWAYLGVNKPIEGWAPLMGMMCLGFLAIFILLTVVFKYLDVLMRLEFEKKQYIISSVEKL